MKPGRPPSLGAVAALEKQLADFLCVERAAMSVELSKLQKEGLLVTKRNHFELLTR